MKCLVVDITTQEKDGIHTCWITMAKLAKFNKEKSKLYHFKKSELIKMYPVVKTNNPELYQKLVNSLPGTILDLEQAVNDFGNAFIKDVKIIKASPFTFDELHK